LLEMSKASNVCIALDLDSVPFLDKAMELAAMGMLPAGSFANKKFCSKLVQTGPDCDALRADLIFDAQTSGGLVLGVPASQVAEAREMLLAGGDQAAVIGTVLPYESGVARLTLS
jgi:selenide, water dikinase